MKKEDNSKYSAETLLTTGEVARFCHVTSAAVLNWIKSGNLKAYKSPGKHHRIRFEDLLDFLKKYEMFIPKELKEIRDSAKKTILVVEDDNIFREVLKEHLSDRYKDFKVYVAENALEAGCYMERTKPDLVILDLKLPGISGFDFCRVIRQMLPNHETKILAMSGFIPDAEKQKVIEKGADDFISKPFKLDDLDRCIKRLIDVEKGGE